MFGWFFKLFRKKYPSKLNLDSTVDYDESTCYLCREYIGPPEKSGMIWICYTCAKRIASE